MKFETRRDAGTSDDDEYHRREDQLRTTPPWFLPLSDKDLDAVASLAMPGSGDSVLHKFVTWKRPEARMFLEPTEAVNMQHIVASYFRFRER